VLVDGVYAPNAEGVAEYRPRTDGEIEELTRVVQSAVGYSENRGDIVTVSNLRFADIDTTFEEAVPEFAVAGFTKSEFMRIAEILILGIVALLVMLLVVRPMLNRVLSAGNLDGGGDTIALAGGGMAALGGGGGKQARIGGGGSDYAIGSDAQGSMPALADGRASGMSQPERESSIDINQVEGRVKESSLNKISEIVNKHPEEAVAILRTWLYQDR